MAGLIDSLNIRQWWKAVTALGGAVLVAGAARGDHAVILLGLGAVLVGIGEWINHPFQTRLHLDHRGEVVGIESGSPRRNRLAGVLLIVVGVGACGLGGWRLLILTPDGPGPRDRVEGHALRQEKAADDRAVAPVDSDVTVTQP